MGGRKREKMPKVKYTAEEIIKFLKDEAENETIEGQLLRKKLIRELYKQIGEPKEEDFKEEFKIAGTYWKKFPGYTQDIDVETESYMKNVNKMPTIWNITYPSQTKIEIEKEYSEAGWHCEVQAYNVICRKYAKHPKYKNLWVRFYSSRDCNKYEYIIELEEK